MTVLADGEVVSLTAPIADADRAGVDLDVNSDDEYSALGQVFEAAQVEWRSGDADRDLARWRTVGLQSSALLKRSKDLWLAHCWCAAQTRVKGLEGLREGLSLIALLTSPEWWDVVHPQPDPEESYPKKRCNIVNELDSPPFLRLIRESVLLRAADGRVIRVKDVLAQDAGGRAVGGDSGEGAADPAQLRTVVCRHAATRIAEWETTTATVEAVVQLAATLVDQFQRQTDGAAPVKLKNLEEILRELRELCVSCGGRSANANADMENAGGENADQDNAAARDAAQSTGSEMEEANRSGGPRLRTREDAAVLLERVAAFLEQTEPSNPLPPILRRLRGLIGKSFLEVLEDLTPDAAPSFRQVAGIRASEESQA